MKRTGDVFKPENLQVSLVRFGGVVLSVKKIEHKRRVDALRPVENKNICQARRFFALDIIFGLIRAEATK